MAKITSKSLINVDVELSIDEVSKTFTLNVAGNLIAKDGVTIQALYSKFVDLWATPSYQDSPFPMYAIDALSGQFQFGTDGATFSGWKPSSDATRQMLRDGGWSEFSNTGVLNRQFTGIVGLGSVSLGSQLYFQRAADDAPTDFTFTDQANEGIQVYGDVSNGNFDKRVFFTGFVREYGKAYKTAPMLETGKTATGAFIVNLLLANSDDLKIQILLGTNQAAGDEVMTGAPYSGITVSYFTLNQSRTISGSPRNFKIIVNGNGATLEQIYAKIQFLLRQNLNINSAGTAGSVTGKTAAALLRFSGETLITSESVFVDNIQGADSNRIEFFDDTNTLRTNPFSASGTISFNAPLIGGGSSFRLMFSAPPGAGNDYAESGAITVNNVAGLAITGTITSATIGFDFDYDGNVQGGFTAGTDRAVVLVGINPGSGKFVVATGTLTRSKTIALSLVAEQDRVYA